MKVFEFTPITIAILSDGVYSYNVDQIADKAITVTKLLFGELIDEITYSADKEAIDAISDDIRIDELVKLTGMTHVKPIFKGDYTGNADILGTNDAEELIAIPQPDDEESNSRLENGIALWSEECANGEHVIVVSNWNEL